MSTNLEKIEQLQKDCATSKRFVVTGEKIFRGEKRVNEAEDFILKLDRCGVSYKCQEFKTMIVVTSDDTEVSVNDQLASEEPNLKPMDSEGELL